MTTLHSHFNDLIGSEHVAIEHAQAKADACDTPVGIWERDGWFAISDIEPESIEPAPESQGWTLHAVVDPGHSNV